MKALTQLRNITLILMLGMASTHVMADVPNVCSESGWHDVIVANTSCHDDGCNSKLILLDDYLSLNDDESFYFEAHCANYDDCDKIAGRKDELAKVKLSVKFWDPAGNIMCHIEKVESYLNN